MSEHTEHTEHTERIAEPDLEAWLEDQPLSGVVAARIAATQDKVNRLYCLVLSLHRKVDAIRQTQIETNEQDGVELTAAKGLSEACRSALSDHGNGG